MKPSTLDCTAVDERDLAERYVANLLSDDEVSAFEAHYFACDRCWERVRTATEVHAAFADEAAHRAGSGDIIAPPGDVRRSPRSSRRLRWPPLAAAAVLGAVGLGLWGVIGRDSGPAEDPGAFRGDDDHIPLRIEAPPGSLTVAWPAIEDADSYRIRLFAADGSVVLERTVADTAVAVLEGAVDEMAGPLYWNVEAFDVLRRRVAASRPMPARTSPPPGRP